MAQVTLFLVPRACLFYSYHHLVLRVTTLLNKTLKYPNTNTNDGINTEYPIILHCSGLVSFSIIIIMDDISRLAATVKISEADIQFKLIILSTYVALNQDQTSDVCLEQVDNKAIEKGHTPS